MHVVDVSPRWDNTTITIDRNHQSVSGKALCVAMSGNGQRLYLGGHSGVWRSDDGGRTWVHPERPQPPSGTVDVPGALLVPNVYDLLVSPRNPDVVLAATGRDARATPGNGIWRSTDGANSWALVHQFRDSGGRGAGTVGGLAVAPDDPDLVFAGGQFGAARSTDGGRTWQTALGAQFRAFYVAVGPASGSTRHVYAAGDRVWHSTDGGSTWREDAFRPALGSPADGVGDCARSLAIDPTDPSIIYLAFAARAPEEDRVPEELWHGVFPGSGDAVWTRLPPPPISYRGTTASGTTFILLHRDPDGRLYLIHSDRRTVHISNGVPANAAAWKRIDPDPVHVDPHGIDVTPDFRWAGAAGGRGRIAMVNDGGVVVSTNGAASWIHGDRLSTLGLVNTAVNPRPGGVPAITIQMGDNNGFFSADGGATWRTQDYRGGDNDCSFADPAQPNRLLVFAPRDRPRKVYLYAVAPGQVPNGGWGTGQRQKIPGPPPVDMSDNDVDDANTLWNCVSGPFNLGNRPLVLTRDREQPRPDGDFITVWLVAGRFDSGQVPVAKLMRTTAMSKITRHDHWVTTATAEGTGVRAFQQGPNLPDTGIGIAQASGGHARPTFYVGDPDENRGQRVWKWRDGMSAWQLVVPGSTPGAPSTARRFFVDPYRPERLYVLGSSAVHRSEDGGATWSPDPVLQTALTEDGAFPVGMTSEAGGAAVLLRDMLFDPVEPRYRFAIGVAGVFATIDGGTSWRCLLRSSAAGFRANNAVYDRVSQPCARMLYVSTSNRGVLRLGPLPPDWSALVGGVTATAGRVTFLRVHDVGTKFGPPGDQLDAEVIVQLDSEPGRSFGFQLRANADEVSAAGMLAQLREAFNRNRRIGLEFVRTGCTTANVIRVISTS